MARRVVLEIIEDIDHRISVVPPYSGLRRFPDGSAYTIVNKSEDINIKDSSEQEPGIEDGYISDDEMEDDGPAAGSPPVDALSDV
ncbi:hypothetical protein BDN70DRAFT_938950 [Pholiota conissans]|uniref:Uncharacterized protein n=1 Tax=Pholiota conissans TaxID=109636 RepID=A0A9P5YMT0_9AGAR|nr:hypothetical protein BDN70DRAFT_938950 [Pholiota conissans]